VAKVSKDFDVRACLVRQLIADGVPRRDIRHDLTLDTSSSGGRADVVVLLEDSILGFEIKSGADTLDRLKPQLERYERCFDNVHVVADKGHGDAVRKTWWGSLAYCHERLILVDLWNSQPARLHLESNAGQSRETSLAPMMRLLWRSETEAVASALGFRRKGRRDAIEYVRENASLKQIRPLVIESLRQRRLSAWEAAFWRKFDEVIV
jgi:hypothetical protein